MDGVREETRLRHVPDLDSKQVTSHAFGKSDHAFAPRSPLGNHSQGATSDGAC